MATDTAIGLLRDLTSVGQAYETGDSGARSKLLHLCKELTAELEQPGETFLRTNWAEVRDLGFIHARPSSDHLLAHTGDRASSRNRSRYLQDSV